jgi:hypothetical protein
MSGVAGFAAMLTFLVGGTAFGESECERKCEQTYKGMSWHISQCKKRNKCDGSATPPSGGGTATGSPASAGAPASGSACEQSCEKAYKGMTWHVNNCKRNKCRAELAEKGVENAQAFTTGTCQQKCELAYHGMKWHIDKCKKDNCKAEMEDNKNSARSWEAASAELKSSLAEVTQVHRRIGAVDCDFRAEVKQRALVEHRKAMQAVADAEACRRSRSTEQLQRCVQPLIGHVKAALAALGPMATEIEGPCPRPGKPIFDPKKGTVFASPWEKYFSYDLMRPFNSIGEDIQRINQSGANGSEKGGCIDVPPQLLQLRVEGAGLLARAVSQCKPLAGRAQFECVKPFNARLFDMARQAEALADKAIKKGDRFLCKVGKAVVGGAEDAFRDIKNFLKGSIVGWIVEKVGRAVLSYLGLDGLVDTAEKVAEVISALKDLANGDASSIIAKGSEVLEEKVSKWLTAKILTVGPVRKLMNWIAAKGMSAAFKFIKNGLVLPVSGWIVGVIAGTPVAPAIPFVPFVAERILNWAADQLGQALGDAALKLDFVRDKVNGLIQPLIAKVLGAARGAIIDLLRSKITKAEGRP